MERAVISKTAHYGFDYHHQSDEMITNENETHTEVYRYFLCFVIKDENVSLPKK